MQLVFVYDIKVVLGEGEFGYRVFNFDILCLFGRFICEILCYFFCCNIDEQSVVFLKGIIGVGIVSYFFGYWYFFVLDQVVYFFIKIVVGNSFFSLFGKNWVVWIGNVNGYQIYVVVCVDYIVLYCYVYIVWNIQEFEGLGCFWIVVVDQVYVCVLFIDEQDILVNVNFVRIFQVFGCFKFNSVVEVGGFYIDWFVGLKGGGGFIGIFYIGR